MIQPKFNIGQKVFCARVNWSSKDIQCPDCLGQRKWHVVAPSGEEWDVECSTCTEGYFSTGLVKEWGDHAHVRELTIGSIRIDTSDQKRPISYMCQETGIGSGAVYDEQEIFSSKLNADLYAESERLRVREYRLKEERDRLAAKKQKRLYKTEKSVKGKTP